MSGGNFAQRDDEWFDVVDAEDRVLHQARRIEVHRQQLWHRAIHVLVFNRDGLVFLQKRSRWKDSAPGCWDSSCSGHLDAGEDYDAAAVRELQEEIGLAVEQAPRRWLRLSACLETGWEFVWIYRMQHDGPFHLHPLEIERGEWFSPAEVHARVQSEPSAFAPAFRHLWALLPWSDDPRSVPPTVPEGV